MRSSVPLIRAGSLAPLVKWLEQRGRAVDEVLARAGVACDPISSPDRLIPMLATAAALRSVAESEDCPDLGWRIVQGAGVEVLGFFGQIILSETTPAGALRRASTEMESFCSHEVLDFAETAEGGTVTARFGVELDQGTLHQAQLQTLALVHSLVSLVPLPPSGAFLGILIPPHPQLGLSHLPPPIAGLARASADASLVLTIPRRVLRSPFRHVIARVAQDPRGAPAWQRLTGAEIDFTSLIRSLIDEALGTGQPSAQVLAEIAGVNVRTLQRRLAADGTSFRALVDDARRARALQQIAEGTAPLAAVSDGLGYSSPAALSRAVRRWTDQPPRALRGKSGG